MYYAVTGARVAVSPVPLYKPCFNFGQGERGGFYECGHDNTITRVVTYSLYQTVFVNATTLVVRGHRRAAINQRAVVLLQHAAQQFGMISRLSD